MVAVLGVSLVIGSQVLPAVPPALAAAPTPLAVKVNFGPAGATVAGYEQDTGAAYDAATGRGWVRQDSLGAAPVPVALTPNTRNRASGTGTNACTTLGAQNRTFIHMQSPASNTTNVNIAGAWEYSLANGQYKVELGYGDAHLGAAADTESHVLRAEGTTLVANDLGSPAANCTASRMRAATGWVTVSDGRLTVDAVGGTNTKLAYVAITSVPVAALSATPGASSIVLDWEDVEGTTSYRIWRGEALPTTTAAGATTQAGLTQVGTSASSAYTDLTAVPGVQYYYSVGTGATPAATNGTVVPAVIDTAAPTRPTLPLAVNFQDRAGVTPAGMRPDFGQAFTNTRGYGWVTPGSQDPLSIVGNGRTRTAGTAAVPPLDTMMHLQYPSTGAGATPGTANGVQRQGAWQLAVADGSYDVTLTVGDREPGTDITRHLVHVEGAGATDYTAVPAPTPNPAGSDVRFQTVTLRAVAVADGFLTVDAIGGTNTKLTDLSVAPASTDLPPAAPTGLTAAPGDGRVTLDWDDGAEADLAGYRVYRSTTTPVATTGTAVSGATPLTDSGYVDTTAANGTTYHYVVLAVDDAGQDSPASSSASATPDPAAPTLLPIPFQLNFVGAATTVAPGFVKDSGQAFSNLRGYGWVRPGTATPLDLSGNGRLRDVRAVDVDLRRRGLMHLQADDVAGTFAGTKTEGAWEAAVANGSYVVTVSVGDQPGAATASCVAPCYDSVHSIDIEGQHAITRFQATAASEFRTATQTVTVSDGRLTIDAADGTNTKLNLVDVEAADVEAPDAPTGLVATPDDGFVELAWTASTATDVAAYRIYASSGLDPVTVTASPLATVDGGTLRHTDAGRSNGTRRSYAIVAVDEAGNASPLSAPASATPADTTAPPAPQGLTATGADQQVSLSWSVGQPSDETTFTIYRSTSPAVAPTAANQVTTLPVTTTTYVDSLLSNATTYHYRVTASDEAGNESEGSNEASATPTPDPDITPPPVPTNVSATGLDNAVSIGWGPITDVGDLLGYQVYRSATSGQPGTLISGPSPVPAAPYRDTTALNGTRYHYTVTSLDTTGNESARSAEVDATPADTEAPAAPTGVTAVAGVNSATVSWDAAPVGSDVDRFRIYRTRNAAAAFPSGYNQFGTFDADIRRSYLDANVVAGTTYYYVVTALDEVPNESLASTVVNATPLTAPDTTAPAAPTALGATVTDDDVALAWTASTSADTAGYEVRRADTLGATPTKISPATVTGTTFTDSDRPAGSTSYYTVVALDTSNNASAPSNTATATIAGAGLDVSYVCQTDAAPVPAGFTKDVGAAYSTATGRGWVTQASLAGTTHTPLDLTANARLRTRAGVTDLQNRLIHLQYGDIVPTPTTGGVLTPGAWELALPNGRYTVSASVGDQPGAARTGCAAPCYDSLHVVRAEGVAVVPAFQATAALEHRTGTATVDVVDGRLSVDAIGGTNTKLNWVRVLSAGPLAPDTTPPGQVTGLLASPGNNAATLTWTAPADTDVAGYDVFRAVGETVVPGPGTRVTTSPVLGTFFADTGLTNGTRYTYAVRAVDTTGNTGVASAPTSVTPLAGAGDLSLKVDFASATTTPAAGYLLDYGQSFGPRTGTGQGTGLSYGWVSPDTSTPVSLVGNGRNRNTEATPANEPDARRASFMHMQYVGTAAGSVSAPGSWEVAVPNGLYTVTVDVGDPGAPVDSASWVNVENQNAVAAFTPGGGTKYATATRTVVVTDGRITLSPVGGTNTKITYVDIASLAQAGRPYPTVVLPANGTTDVVTNISPTASNELPGGAVDPATVVSGVRLTRVADGVPVAGVGGTSGGGDTVSFRIAAGETLLPSTLYRFDVLDTATDVAGNRFVPFSTVFTTRADTTTPGGGGAAFDRSDAGATRGNAYTSLTFGPDGRLYAGSIFGQIYRWDVRPDGTLGNQTVINTVRTHASAAGWEGAPDRTVIGLAFDPASTAENPILWITDNYAYLGSDVPNGTGAISRLTGANLQNYQEVVVNLPRSIKDHETNSLAFHNGRLYAVQGSMNAMGAQDGTWKKPENLLSAAVLELDPAKLPASLPLDVSTPDLEKSSTSSRVHARTYDPYAANAPLTLYATGVRNAYDLLWHSNGNLYVGTNGSAAGGNTPAVPNPLPASCANRPDGGYTGPSAPALTNNRQDETDYIFNVKKGKYYGHPNPLRCEFILNAGNPTGYAGNPLFKVNAYPAGQQADPNYDLGNVYDAGLHASANGTIEYQNAGAFGGALKGKLIVVRYSANQELTTFDVRANGSLSAPTTGITGFTGLAQPLDVVEDPSTGNLYVSELTNNFANTGIRLLKPQGGSNTVGRAEVTPRVVITDVAGGAASAPQNVTIRNVGAAPLTITGATLGGADPGLFTRGGAYPLTIPANGSNTVPVTFNPTVPGPRGAVLSLTTDSLATPTVTTTLRGLGTAGTGGASEPSLQWILDTLQIPVDVGDPDPTTNDMPVSSALIGDEVEVEAFRSDPFDNIVRFEPLSLFGPTGSNGNVVTVGVHDSEDPTDPTGRTVVGVGPNNQNQRVLPTFTGTSEVPSLPEAFGLDFTWHGLGDRVTYQEDALNTWAAIGHKVRVYPLKNADGTTEPYAYVVAPEDVPTGVDFQDAVMIVRNVQPVVTAGQGLPTADSPEKIFTAVKGTTSPAQTVTITNSGTTPLEIGSAVLTGPQAAEFTLAGGAATVPVGGTATYQVTFRPGSGAALGTRSAALRIGSDSAATPTLDVGLHGLNLNGLEGGNEPPLLDVVRTLGRNIDVGWTGLTAANPATGANLRGEEVVAPLFTRAAAGPVTMKPVARFSPDEQLPFGWYLPTPGAPERTQVASIASGQFQTLNPAIAAGGASSFDPGGASFGLYVDSRSFNRFSYTQDGLNTGVPHAVRTYPARDRAGVAIPNTYLVTFEDASNGDYQDYVFEVGNVRIAGSTGGTTPVARIDFGPATSTLATGYTRDSGAAFVTGGSGWVNQTSRAPQAMTALTRDRASATLNQATLLLMQPTAAQSPAGPGAWRYTLPNGTYSVTVGVGDPDFDDSVHRITAEGQVVVPAFTPTAAARSTVGTATVTVSDGVLDLDAAGGTNTKIQYVDIDRPVAGTDTTPPVVTATLSGLQQSPGVYRGAATITVAAADPESSTPLVSLSVDGGPFQAYTAPVPVTTSGAHTVRARAQNGAGLFTTTASQSFSVVAAGAARGDIAVSNLDGVPFPDRLVMNRIQTPASAPLPTNVVHDVATLRIANTGTGGLNVTALDLTGPFALVNPASLPALVPAGGSLDVPVRFTATTIGTDGGLWEGTVTVRSDDADEPALPVELAGFWQSVSEGGVEPTLTELTRLFGYGTQITTPGQPINQQGLIQANGDEVLSPYWLRANAAQPVTVRQLAAFHTQGNTASFFWHAKGSNTTSTVVTHVGDDGQSILPRRNDAGRTPGVGTFNPTGPFGLKIDPEWSDPSRNSAAVDLENGCPTTAQCGHHLRIWPARDRSGAIIASTYLVAMDYSGINYDYQDNVYLVTNIRPELATDPSAPAPAPGVAGLDLGFSSAVAGSLADADGQGTGFRSTQPNKRDVTVGSDSYRASLLDLDTTGAGTLRVTSSGTATEGTNGSADNTLVNGLRLAFDGTGEPFSVVARVNGPITQLDGSAEQVGIQLGNDQDNYVKAAVIRKTVGGATGPAIEFYAEQDGLGTTVGTPVLVPTPAGVTSLELALLAQPGARTIRAAYRANDGAWVVLPTAYPVPASFVGRLFDIRSQAGLLVSHKGGEQLVASYDSFGVRPGDVAGTAPAPREALARIDTGSSQPFTDAAGNVWAPDTGLFAPTSAPAEGNRADAIAGTLDDPLYATYRGNTGSVTPRTISYALPAGAATTVDLRLHFAERAAANNAAGRRLFDIDVEGRTVRTGFDIFTAAGGTNTATVLAVNNVTVRGGVLNLALRATADYPAISAIEVLCQGPCPVDTTAPGAPVELTALGSSAGVALAWTEPGDLDVIGYRVYRSASATGTFTELTSAPVLATQYADTTAPANAESFYRVVAVDGSGNASSPATASATRLVPVQGPIRVNTGGPAQSVGGVAWTGCTSLTACGGAVTGGFAYSEADTIAGIPAGLSNTILQSEWTGGQSGAGAVPVGQRAFGFSFPVQNGDYRVRLHFAELNKTGAGQRTFDVRLENATVLTDFDVFQQAGGIDRAVVRQFPASVTDGAVTIDFVRRIENAKISAIEILPGADTTAPAAPGSLTATPGPTGIALGWPAVSGDDTAGYRVFRSATADGTFVQLGQTTTGTSYADASAPAGARSYYQVRAVDTSGNVSTPVAANALRPEPVPAQVVGVAASGSTTGVSLTWTAATAPTVTGYHVYRSTSMAGTYTRLNGAVLTTPTYLDTTAPAGATSYYQVTAVNATGESPRSATVSALRPGGTQAPIRINAGGPAQTVAGTTWSACSAVGSCSGRVSGGNAYTENDTITGIPAGVNNTILQSEWTGGAFGAGAVPVGQRAFGFSVPVSNGSYQVRLHFAELNKTGAGQRTFDVRLENTTVLSSFDVWQQAGGIDRAIVRQFDATVTDGAMTIDFIRRIENAKVSAIEIIPVTTPAPSPIRINAGGPAQTVAGTTWSACSAVGTCSGRVSGGFTHTEADTITGIPAGMSNTIFQSEWTGGAAGPGVVPVGQRAFGFSVPVPNGAYQVRLHFAELNKTGAGQRTFDVRLEGSTVLTAFDVWQQAGGIDRAIVRQFSTTVTDGAITIDFIRRVENAKVSAIEIIPVG